MVPTTDEKSTTRPADGAPMWWSRLNAVLWYQGIRFFERETGTSDGSLGLAGQSGDERRGNTAKLEPKTRSIVTNETSDQPSGLATRWPNEQR